jgi:hypothetical protein
VMVRRENSDLPSRNASLAFKTSGLESQNGSQGSPPGRHLLTSIYRSSRGYRNEGLAFVLFCGLHLEMRNPEIVR